MPTVIFYSFFFVQQVNDFVRDKFTDKDNSIPFIAEILAGGCVSIMSQRSCSVCSVSFKGTLDACFTSGCMMLENTIH